MKMKRLTIISCLLLLGITHSSFAQDKKEKPLYKDANAPIEKRINDLVSRMTLEEKVYQLNQVLVGNNDNPNNVGEAVKKVPAEIGSLIYFGYDPVFRNSVQRHAMEESRLGIPILFGYDVIHGFRTIYPISIAQACSWNPELVKRSCSVAAQEARISGVDWTFSPMIDVARDPRWGRVAEGYGEDPYTNAVFAVASVQGYQGTDLSNTKNIAACLKHYVGYGASEGGRDYTYSEISKQTLWNTYLPPFEAGVKAGAATLMSAFNDISGVPASSNHYTLTEVLKDKWKHDGFVVSDWDAVKQLIRQGVAGSKKEATLKAFQAGVEMDMNDRYYLQSLAELVNEGAIPIEKINDAVGRVLRVKFRLGLFDNPYIPVKAEDKRYLLPENLKTVEKLVEESIVLLKNEKNTLPLSTKSRLAVIGPMAKNKEHLLGSWSAHGKAEDVVSIYEGLESEFKNTKLLYAEGCDFDGNDTSKFAEATKVAQGADAILVCLGEKKTWSGENGSRTLSLPQIQENLLLELKKLGKPIVLILSNGRPLELNRIESASDAIVEIWQPGVNGGRPVAGILSGRINPSGKLAMTFPYSAEQIPIYYNMRQSARKNKGGYQDIPNNPRYEFTYGLSYTTFKYGELKATQLKVKRGDKLVVEIPVTNTGIRDGAETVHWFISDPVCSITRPIKELKFFEKQVIKAGDTKIFRFEVDLERDFSYVDETGKRVLESGDYFISVKENNIIVELVD